jgi:hypothetical protein
MENETFWKLHSNIALHLIHNNQQHDIMYRDWAEILSRAVSKRQEKNDMVKQLAGVCGVGASFLHRFSQSEGSSWKEIKLRVVSSNLCHGCSPLSTLHP